MNYFSDFAGGERGAVVAWEDVLAGADAREAGSAAVCGACFTLPYFAASHSRTSEGLYWNGPNPPRYTRRPVSSMMYNRSGQAA